MSELHAGVADGGGNRPVARSFDQQLIERVLAGEQKAFELLVRQYQGKVTAQIARLESDPDKVRDLVQETWIKAYRALPTFRGDAAFYTWLFRIAVNTTKNHWISEGKTVPLRSLDEENEETEYVLPQLRDHETPERQLLRREMMEKLQTAIDALSPEMKKAILFRDVQGFSYEEIAKALDCPVGTVRSRIFRGRQEIANRMREYLGNREGGRGGEGGQAKGGTK